MWLHDYSVTLYLTSLPQSRVNYGISNRALGPHSAEPSVLILQIPATVPIVSIKTTKERFIVLPVVLINLTLAGPTAGTSVKEAALAG